MPASLLRATIVLLVLGCAAGCATAPWTRMAVSGGGVVQTIADPDPRSGDGTDVNGALSFRAEIDLLQNVREARDFDVGVGYAFFDLPDAQRVREARSAVMVAGRYHLYVEEYEDGAIFRVSLGGNADVLLYANGFGGAGGSVTLDIEIATRTGWWAGFGSGSDSDGIAIGGGAVAPGEAGIGLRAEVSYHVLEDETHRWMLTGGLVVRFPALAFIGIYVPTGS